MGDANALAFVSVLVVGAVGIAAPFITAYYANRRQAGQLEHDHARQRDLLKHERDRQQTQLTHERELRDVEELRPVVDEASRALRAAKLALDAARAERRPEGLAEAMDAVDLLSGRLVMRLGHEDTVARYYLEARDELFDARGYWTANPFNETVFLDAEMKYSRAVERFWVAANTLVRAHLPKPLEGEPSS